MHLFVRAWRQSPITATGGIRPQLSKGKTKRRRHPGGNPRDTRERQRKPRLTLFENGKIRASHYLLGMVGTVRGIAETELTTSCHPEPPGHPERSVHVPPDATRHENGRFQSSEGSHVAGDPSPRISMTC